MPVTHQTRCGLIALILTAWHGPLSMAEDVKPAPDAPVTPSTEVREANPNLLQRWLNPKSAPFIPVPEIATDPTSGLTLGLLAVYLKTDSDNEISKIVAPDVLHNPYFGYGTHARIYSFSSSDAQWSLVGGIKERVEREFDAEYQSGRQRDQTWSIGYSLIYDVDGTPRFYGVGNRTHESAETNFTNSQELAQVNVGLNLTHEWQILYTGRLQVVDVRPGTLDEVASIETRFGQDILGTDKLLRNRLSVIYDSRDDVTIASHGMQWIAYSGFASRDGILNDSLYSEAGFDGRVYWPIWRQTTIAAHTAIRYLLSANDVPFWALSSVGGGESDVGGPQALRGFGTARFYGRNSFAATVELRRNIMTFNAAGTNVDIELSPFMDVGRVFNRSGTFPLASLHPVYGVGFRGIAKPFVVGHVDIGYGSEGVAVFTGLNYPF